MDKVSYALGIGIGHQLANMGGKELNIDDFAQAVKDVLAGNELKVKSSEAQRIVQEYFAAQEEKINRQRAEQGKAQKEAGEKYLAEKELMLTATLDGRAAYRDADFVVIDDDYQVVQTYIAGKEVL